MERYSSTIDIRWADLDPNFHVLHSKYYDFGASSRISFLTDHGLGLPVLMEHQIGPILFREECVFKRELRFGDKVTVDLHLVKSTVNYSRWTIRHEIIKNESTLAAIITVDGAWLDTGTRKLMPLPDAFKKVFDLAPKSSDFKNE